MMSKTREQSDTEASSNSVFDTGTGTGTRTETITGTKTGTGTGIEHTLVLRIPGCEARPKDIVNKLDWSCC